MRVQSRHNSSRKSIARWVVLSVLVVLIGLALPKVFSITAAVIMYPIHSADVWLKESSSLFPMMVRDRLYFQNKIQELENELVIAGGLNVTQQRLLEENLRLRQLLGAKEESRILAAVIARPDELPYDFLQIDRGSDHGVEVGSPVFIGDDVVIGLVVHTATDYSFVELFTTSGFETSTFISGPNVVATMEGYGGGVARVRVPQGIPITVGNLVYLPSVEPGVFGRISYVENLPTQPEQYGYITPEISISSLFQVSVGKQSQIAHSATEIDSHILELMKSELLVKGLTVGEIGTSTKASSTPESESI
ncbi:hypothetical protein H6784_01520 [Candidatus Nomurabacteria bacterium]|nr:hypothetical protein [Candidatus Kaiserbacteria bacterium]MCB9814073.1 hypothetical protein [Candidatus Nomurabacteria bacterium]